MKDGGSKGRPSSDFLFRTLKTERKKKKKTDTTTELKHQSGQNSDSE